MLDQQDPSRLMSPPGPHDALLSKYDGFLRQACGASEHARIYRLRYARQFLGRHFGDDPPTPGRLTPADIRDYFRRHAGSLRPGSVAVLASSLRAFLRYLALSHGFDASLAGIVPTAPRWPMDRLPRSLSDRDLVAILARSDARTATGRRDLAMMRCMSDRGLRVGEVTALTLDDIDWRRGVATIGAGKGRARELPLPTPPGRAIAAHDGLRPRTYATLIALMACTGLRIGEALALKVDDVELKAGAVTVRQTKFRKSRLVPPRATAVGPLRDYAAARGHRCQGSMVPTFSASEAGRPLPYGTVRHTFHELLRKAIPGAAPIGRVRPRLHDLRHTFACRRPLGWYGDGTEIDRSIDRPSAYLGHVKVTDTCRYLTGVPELLAPAGRRFERCAGPCQGDVP
jgi:integrase